MKKVGAWEASDGERFETRKACEQHEAWLEAERFFAETIRAVDVPRDDTTALATACVEAICTQPQNFRAIIRDLIGLTERKGKPKAASASGARSAKREAA